MAAIRYVHPGIGDIVGNIGGITVVFNQEISMRLDGRITEAVNVGISGSDREIYRGPPGKIHGPAGEVDGAGGGIIKLDVLVGRRIQRAVVLGPFPGDLVDDHVAGAQRARFSRIRV